MSRIYPISVLTILLVDKYYSYLVVHANNVCLWVWNVYILGAKTPIEINWEEKNKRETVTSNLGNQTLI
jgi:hypothetical protein